MTVARSAKKISSFFLAETRIFTEFNLVYIEYAEDGKEFLNILYKNERAVNGIF